MRDPCWVCQAETRLEWSDQALTVERCRRCGHRVAEHTAADGASDYHLAYDQDGFLAALRATRVRQARAIVAELRRLELASGVFDYGSGRGFFLETARELGVTDLGGGDTSALAMDWLREQRFAALPLPADGSLAPIRQADLGFAPAVVCFLDVIEHFAGDLRARVGSWLRELGPSVRAVVFKVPVADGLLFRAAAMMRRLGLPRPMHQLFQVGTSPPHVQYFSRASLDRFCQELGLRRAGGFVDLDFEPQHFRDRVEQLRSLPSGAVALAARMTGAAAMALGKVDTEVVIATRPRGARPAAVTA